MHGPSEGGPIRVALVSLVGLTLASLSLAGCANAGREVPTASSGTTTAPGTTTPDAGPEHAASLTIAVAAPATGINPASVNTAFGSYALLAYEPLVYKGSAGISPALAESWQIDDDNTQIDFAIRQGVTFADGDAVTAEAVKASLDYCGSDASVNKATMAYVDSVTVPDGNHVSVHLTAPNPSIEWLFSQLNGCGMIISPKGLADIDDLTVDHDSAGAGAYVYTAAESVPGDTYTYLANPTYYDKANKQHYDKIVLRVIANAQAAFNAVQTGQVDATTGDLTTVTQAKDAGFNLAWTPFIWSGLNLIDRGGETTPALGDVRVRQAINYAIDRDSITSALLGDFGVPTAQISAEGFDGHSKDLESAYSYDPEKAKELLTEAGYADGFTLPVMTVAFGGLDTLVTAITPMLAAVGITVDATVATDEKTYMDGMTNHQYSAVAVGYGSQPMYEMALNLVNPAGLPFNGFGTDDEKALSIVDALSRASGDEQKALAVELNTYLTDQAWFAPVLFGPQIWYYTDATAGIEVSGQSPTVQVLDIYPAG
jgi:peptide/nickel transport system substrate-binding protein